MERKNYAVITVTVIVIALVSLDIYYWSSESTRIYADKVLAWTFLLITAGILLILELAGALFRNIKAVTIVLTVFSGLFLALVLSRDPDPFLIEVASASFFAFLGQLALVLCFKEWMRATMFTVVTAVYLFFITNVPCAPTFLRSGMFLAVLAIATIGAYRALAFPSGGKKASRLYIAHVTLLIVAIAGWLIIYFMTMNFSSHGI